MILYCVYELNVHSYYMDVKCTSIKIYYSRKICDFNLSNLLLSTVEMCQFVISFSYALDVHAEMHHKYGTYFVADKNQP